MKRANTDNQRLIVYQTLPRLLSNDRKGCVAFGSLEQNGSGKLNDYTPKLLDSIKELGVNCIWFTGIIENATKTDFPGIPSDNPNVVKGEAGSPYAIRDYYDVNPCLAENVDHRMHEFESLVDRCHARNIKVMIDFVPNHTARVYHSDAAPDGVDDFGVSDDISMMFSPNNNYYYITNQQFAPNFPIDGFGRPYKEFPAKATGNDCFTPFPGVNDWYETAKLNYGHDYFDHSNHFDPMPDTWRKMLHILEFWAGKGVDGFRCDMVFMVPIDFWNWMIPRVKKKYPHLIFVGEIYDVALYRPFLSYGCFDYLYDKVNLYDTLVGIECHSLSAARLTGCWQTVDGIGNRMLNFLENHDEVRFGSKAYAGNPAHVIPSLVVSSMIGNGPMMIYFGQEIGESATDNEGFAGDNCRTSIFDYWSYDSMRRWNNSGQWDTSLLTEHERWLRKLYVRVLNLCNTCESFRIGNFFDLMYVNLRNPALDPNSIYAFIRYVKGKEAVLIVANFGDKDADVRVFIPKLAFEMASLPEGNILTSDLLTDAIIPIVLKPDDTTLVSVKGKNAAVLRLQ